MPLSTSTRFFSARRLSLRTKFLVFTLLATLLGLSALQVLLSDRMQDLSRRWLQRRALGIATILGSAVAPGIEFDSPESVREALAGLARTPDVLYAVVRRQDGSVLSSFRADAAPPLAAIPAPGRPQESDAPQIALDGRQLRVDLGVRGKGGARGVLSIGFSLGELDHENLQSRYTILALCSLLAVLIIATILLITSSVLRVVRSMTGVARRIAAGDLTQGEVSAKGQDEIGQMAHAFNQMISGQRSLVQQIADISDHLAGAAAQLYAAAQDQEDSASKQAIGVEEVGQTIQNLLDSATHIADAAHEVLLNAQRSKETADSTSTRIAELSHHTSRINEILEVIRDIADKSDLLALNASLEALRAGEAGRPFQLVAGEMRRLAERVTASVQDVKTLISDIRASGSSTVMANEEGRKLTDSTTESARKITVVTSQQRTGTEMVSQAVGHISDLLSQSVLAAQQTRTSAGVLKEQAERLSDVVGRFQLSDKRAGAGPGPVHAQAQGHARAGGAS